MKKSLISLFAILAAFAFGAAQAETKKVAAAEAPKAQAKEEIKKEEVKAEAKEEKKAEKKAEKKTNTKKAEAPKAAEPAKK